MTKIKVPALMIAAAVVIGFVFGTVLTGQVHAESQGLLTQLRVFTQVLRIVEANYVEEVDSTELVRSGIRGVLEDLDPHSTYVDPESFERMNERNTGEYEGIGVSFEIRDGWITVISAMEGGPSANLGIRPGDRIVKIAGESARGLANEDVVGKLKGPKGTSVTISIARPGLEKEIEFTIPRDKIPIFSVPYAFMLDDGETGYIRMIRFSATTAEELEKALVQLEGQGMKRLVFDLRNNTGGFLNQAIEVADKFIGGNQVIVSTKGRIDGSSQFYYSTDATTHPRVPLIVLINHGSASASEIVAGAIQDHDRGVLAGVTTFGKGLVQRQFMLPDDSALLLTVAHYYTPSGRLIQRSYTDREEYLDHWRKEEDELVEAEQDTIGKPLSYTLNEHRPVYGGGGINPDVRITADFDLTDAEVQLETSRLFFEFANSYATKHVAKNTMTEDDFVRSYQLPDAAITQFTAEARADTAIKVSAEDFTKEREYIRTAIKREMAGNLWGQSARYRVILAEDPMIAAAMTHFPQAELMAKIQERPLEEDR
jgi:carboxyl-terminal processing protease